MPKLQHQDAPTGATQRRVVGSGGPLTDFVVRARQAKA
jgi:hypothetical protein